MQVATILRPALKAAAPRPAAAAGAHALGAAATTKAPAVRTQAIAEELGPWFDWTWFDDRLLKGAGAACGAFGMALVAGACGLSRPAALAMLAIGAVGGGRIVASVRRGEDEETLAPSTGGVAGGAVGALAMAAVVLRATRGDAQAVGTLVVAAATLGLAAGATAGRWLDWRARGTWTGARKLRVPGAAKDDEA